jgi:hypothetical protein
MDRQTGIYSLADNWIHKATRYWVETLSIFANLITIGLLAGTFLSYGANLISLYLIGLLTTLGTFVGPSRVSLGPTRFLRRYDQAAPLRYALPS